MKKQSLLVLFSFFLCCYSVNVPYKLNGTLLSSKIGLGWGSGENLKALADNGVSKVSWIYNWSPNNVPGAEKAGLDFAPMLWGPGQAADFEQVARAGFNSSTAVLGFNEPDNSGQSNLSPSTAAALWKQYLQPLAGKLRLGAPAVTSAPSGKPWLQNFFSACSGCTVDFIPIHWYGSDSSAFESYVTDIHNTFNKNIWITEWACVEYAPPPCDQNSVNTFLQDTTAWLTQQSWVERYAWFGQRVNGIPTEDAFLSPDGQTATPLGTQYSKGP